LNKRKEGYLNLNDGKLVTQDLIEINVDVREFIDRTYYEDWAGPSVAEDPAGNP